MNGVEVCGRGIKVGWPNSTPGSAVVQPPAPLGTAMPGVPDMQEAAKKALDYVREISGGSGGLVVAASPGVPNV